MSKNHLNYTFKTSHHQSQTNFFSFLQASFMISQKESQFQYHNSAMLQLRLKLKTFSAEKQKGLVKFLKAIFSEEKRLICLPALFYYSIREGHFELEVKEDKQEVLIIVRPGKKLDSLIKEFLNSSKETKIPVNIEKSPFVSQLDLKISGPISSKIKQYCEQKGEESLVFYLINESQLNIEMDKNLEVRKSIDKILRLILDDYQIPFFSLAEDYSLSQNVRIFDKKQENQSWDPESPNPKVFQSLESFVHYLISFFQDMKREETKNFLKCFKYLRSMELQEQVAFEVFFKDLMKIEGSVDLNGVGQLLEFLTFHPKPGSKEQIESYKKKYLGLKF